MELKGKDLMNFGLLKGYAENELKMKVIFQSKRLYLL